MTLQSTLPRAVVPFIEFPQILRAHGFSVAPEQTTSFIESIGLLGPRSIEDLRNAGLAMFAIPRERRGEYDALFRAFFMGQTVSAPVMSDDDEDDVDAFEEQDGIQEIDVAGEEEEVGEQAVAAEALSRREFGKVSDDEALRQFNQRAGAALPRRRSYRRMAARRGTAFDLRKSLRQAVKRDGEIFELYQTRRKTRQRPIVLLIDVSGSMQDQSEPIMRFAHALKQAGERVEVFTFGTRLTRITRALSDKNLERSLSRVSALVADFDGGTRIGDALDALLSVPRFAGTMRGAAVVILSDGFERGEPHTMIDAVRRISRTAWRLDWLSPLAGEVDYVPRTEALAAVLPFLDSLSDGSDIATISHKLLKLTDPRARRAA